MVPGFTALVAHDDDWPKGTIDAVVMPSSKRNVHASDRTNSLHVSDGEGFFLVLLSDAQG